MFEFLMLIMGFTGLAYFGQKFKIEQEMQDDELENIRHYLLDKYQDELKQNHPEIDFNNSEDTVDFCLKLQSMDDDALEMAYYKVKEQDSE